MSKRRSGARNGVANRVSEDVAIRLRDIRALWLAAHNDDNHTIAEQSAEFYYAVGDILEGRSVHSLDLQKIDRKRVLQHMEE